MTKKELIAGLGEIGLALMPYSEKQWTIGTSRFANIMMSFNPQITVDDYSGSVSFKIINASLFTGKEIKEASSLVHDFLMTPVNEREIT